MNTQPNTFTWNLMGMMNNCVYRVKIHPSVRNGSLALRYEHPCIAGPAVGGWMNRSDEKPATVVEVSLPLFIIISPVPIPVGDCVPLIRLCFKDSCCAGLSIHICRRRW